MFVTLRHSLVFALIVLSPACQPEAPFPADDTEANKIRDLYNPAPPLGDPTNALADSADAAALGKVLFSDTRLSPCGLACESCHNPSTGFADTVPLSNGCNGAHTARNAPSLLNAGYRHWLFWDGRKDSLWAQASGPLLNPNEMGSDVSRLRSVLQEFYAADYQALFAKDPVGTTDDDELLANFGKVMEAYERTLVRVRSPFDENVARFLATYDSGGDVTQDPIYLQLKTFVRTGNCVTCHSGSMLSDESFHNIGVADPSEGERRGRASGMAQLYDPQTHTFLDPLNGVGEYSDDISPTNSTNAKLNGMFNDFNNPTALSDLEGAFKTPSLRNVALTAPYLHDGSRATLSDMVDFYNQGGDTDGSFAGHKTTAGTITQLNLTPAEKQALVDMLESLTGTETP